MLIKVMEPRFPTAGLRPIQTSGTTHGLLKKKRKENKTEAFSLTLVY